MDDSLLPNFNYVKNILVLALLSHVLNNFGQASIYCIDFTNIKAVLVKVLNSFECLTCPWSLLAMQRFHFHQQNPMTSRVVILRTHMDHSPSLAVNFGQVYLLLQLSTTTTTTTITTA